MSVHLSTGLKLADEPRHVLLMVASLVVLELYFHIGKYFLRSHAKLTEDRK